MEKFPHKFFPSTYMVFDIETTGFSSRHDYITQFGVAVVRDRKLDMSAEFFINIPPGSMHKKAEEVTGISEKICNEQGVTREQGVRNIYHTLMGWRAKHEFPIFVGHNAAKFDMPFIENEFKRQGIDFMFGVDEIVDTGAMVKALQVGTYPRNESNLDFMLRVGSIRAKGVKWSLDKYCIERFKLAARIEEEGLKSHDAVADCVITHWVLEEMFKEWGQLNATNTG